MNKTHETMQIQLLNRLDELERLAVAMDQLGKDWGIPANYIMELNLAVEELFTNIVFYAMMTRKNMKSKFCLSIRKRAVS